MVMDDISRPWMLKTYCLLTRTTVIYRTAYLHLNPLDLTRLYSVSRGLQFSLCSIDCILQCLDDRLWIFSAKDSCSGHDNIAACIDVREPSKSRTYLVFHTSLGTNVNGLRADTTIDFNVLLREPCTEFCHLGDTSIEEFLTSTACAESGVGARQI